jgi:RNA polymerase sigma-70 factor (ECF subfamily)
VLVVPIRASNKDFFHHKSESKSDNYLVQQCLQGDTQSFGQLYRRHQQKVRSILYQLCGPSCLDDLVQEVFLRAWKGLPKFCRTAKFSSWLYRITWNVACDYRQATVQGRMQLQLLQQRTPTQQQAPDLISMHYQDLVQPGLSSLSHCTVLVLHDLEQISQKEIADIVGYSFWNGEIPSFLCSCCHASISGATGSAAVTKFSDRDSNLVNFLCQHRPQVPPAAPDLEQQILQKVKVYRLPTTSKRARLWLVPSVAAGLALAIVGYRVFIPARPTAAELASVEKFMESNWQSTVSENPEEEVCLLTY